MHTTIPARALEHRAAVRFVRPRDTHGLAWRRIAAVVLDDADRQPSVLWMYESGRRHLRL
ncbi:hypothetical protein AB0C40_19575 [Streptomyces brevispora]|uniref:hypothetical protein n=1 Tax=Streptomyces brevispora TaxID=887462 RepID=UPI0033EB96B9